ncbi:MAG: PAS domain S-box protein [Candidatus Aegiribacteria sp.]
MSSDMTASVIHDAPVMISTHDRDHNILWANGEFCRRAGLPLSELAGKKCYSIWKLDKPCAGCPEAATLKTGLTEEAELTPYNQDGWSEDQGSLYVRSAPLRDENGSVIGTVEVIYDITERICAREARNEAFRTLQAANQQLTAAEQQLKASNQQLRAAEQQLRASNRQLKATENNLKERIKELNCLFELSGILERTRVPVGDTLQATVNMIPPAVQYPEEARARITLNGECYTAGKFQETEHRISSPITVHGETAGSVEVSYIRELPFLKEESDLIENISLKLGIYIEQKDTLNRLHDIEWMLTGEVADEDIPDPEYGDLSRLNQDGVILNSVGREQLNDITSEYLGLLGTSAAIYERNGDYALGLFSSGWCRMMDAASRNLCGTSDNREALNSGKWLCHESCWQDASLRAIEEGGPVDIECSGGINLYAFPVRAGGRIVGAVNFGYGDPPSDGEKLQELSKEYRLPLEDLRRESEAYRSRPGFIVSYAKKRLQKAAGYLGYIIERKEAEEELERSRAMLARTERIARVGSWEWDVESDTVKWSEELYRIFGRDPSSGAPSFAEHPNIYSPEDMALLREAVNEALASGTPYELELHAIRPDGSGRLCRIRGHADKEPGRRASRLYGSFQDITEQREAEEALRSSEEKYRLLADNTVDCIWRLSLDGVFQYINPAVEDLLGYSPEEIIGTRLSDYCDEENFAVMAGEIAEALADPEEFERAPFTAEMVRRDGSVIQVEITGKVICSEAGDPIVLQGVTRDITERVTAEKEMARLMSAVEQAAEVFVITDTDGTILYVNPAFEEVTGYRREEAVGSNPRILKSGEHDEEFYRELWNTLTEGNTWTGRFVNRRKDGKLYTEEAVISPVRDPSGKITHYAAVKRDITEQLRVSAMLEHAQKMESVGRLAGGVAHDYNNMLSVIMGYTEMALNRTDPSSALHADLTEVLSAAKRSADITRQLLAFARKQTVEPKVLDINDTLEAMLRMLRQLIGEDIDLVWCPARSVWPVMIDPTQVDQILANLCVNARDAIHGVGKVTIETANVTMDKDRAADHQDASPGNYVMLSVGDTGRGMKRELMQNVFEPFYTTKDTGSGTGLGLATVYGIVRQNDGFIDVSSEPGRGTVFRIYLPRYEGSPDDISRSDGEDMITGKGEILLLVEDEPAIRDMGELMLRKLGYEVISTGTPDETIEMVREHTGRIDLLITDIVMPGMNGRELADRLQELYPELKLLFMSGYTADVVAHHGVLDDGLNFIQKPFTLRELSAKVHSALYS